VRTAISPRSRVTVGAKVVGSLPPRLCARFKLILIVSGSSHPCTTNAFIGVSSRCLPQCHIPPLGLDVEPLQGGQAATLGPPVPAQAGV
jgi:hypothetical protein